ncbi:ATP-binding protein [Aquabacterium sp.]|uniref:hybrid sensor histidine kinase/response regulator n=1 Tax=Aquabacterium sp. TaxID=1872578 RepID=UPI0035AFBB1C
MPDLPDLTPSPEVAAELAGLRAELEVARAEAARWRTSFDLSAAGMALVGLDGVFLDVNQRLSQFLGYSVEQLRRLHFQDVTYAEDLPVNLRAMDDLIGGRVATYHLEKRYLRGDGECVWGSVSIALVRDGAGVPQHFIAVVEDVTERQRAIEALRQRETLLSSMGKFVPGIIHKIGFLPDGRAEFLYISDRALDMFELDPEVMARDFYAHHTRVHPDDLAYVRRLAQAPAPGQTLEPVDFEYRVILPGKGLRWYGGRVLPEVEADGSVVWYGHTADVTEHKQFQAAKVAAVAADEANRAKSEFLSRMSHELRTPLNAVIGFAQLLRMDSQQPLSAAQRGKIALIERAGAHLLAVIGDVLDLSRIDSGSLPLSLEPVLVEASLDEAMQLVAVAAREAGIEIEPGCLSQVLHVQADRLRLRQILVNLLSNAVKYNRPGGRVMTRCWREAGQVAVEVSDTGRGLTPEQCTHLFEPFNRLGAESTGVEGTGIGLVIVRRLIELMGGHIEVSSELGVGSRFVVWLPQASPPAAPPAQAEEPLTISGTLQGEDGAYTVLYAEDNEVNVALIRQVMALRPACRLLVAYSGAEAVELARRHRPDLLLLDMHLGDMSGFEVAEALERDAATASIPRVALSADAMPDTVHRAKARGFAAYLTKPLDVMALLRCLDEQITSQP